SVDRGDPTGAGRSRKAASSRPLTHLTGAAPGYECVMCQAPPSKASALSACIVRAYRWCFLACSLPAGWGFQSDCWPPRADCWPARGDRAQPYSFQRRPNPSATTATALVQAAVLAPSGGSEPPGGRRRGDRVQNCLRHAGECLIAPADQPDLPVDAESLDR